MRDKEQPWIKRSLREKRKHVIDSHHEPPVECLMCETKVMPQDVWRHDERCPGRREPHRLDRWVSETEAAQRLTKVTLRRLAKSGVIRTREAQCGTEYLVRDLWRAVRGAELYRSEAAERPAEPTLSRLQGLVLGALSEGGMTRGALEKSLGRNSKDIDRAMVGLIRLGLVARRYRRGGRMFERRNNDNLKGRSGGQGEPKLASVVRLTDVEPSELIERRKVNGQ